MTPTTYTKTQSNLTWRVTFDWDGYDSGTLTATTILPDDSVLRVTGYSNDQAASGFWNGYIDNEEQSTSLGVCPEQSIYTEALDHFAEMAKPKPVEKPKTGLERMMGLFGGGS